MDVKYAPKVCYAGTDGNVFFQYTMIEEASRKRFIHAYKEQSSDPCEGQNECQKLKCSRPP